MYKIGESVVYGTTGVCTIISIGPLSMHGVDRHRQYYTLQPLHQSGSVYVPAGEEQPKAMRKPMTQEEARELLTRIPSIEPYEIQSLNYKQRTDAFSAALHENCCDSLVQMIKAIDRKKQRGREKQQYNVDNSFMKRAMNLLCSELAFALDQPVEEVRTQVVDAIRSCVLVEVES